MILYPPDTAEAFNAIKQAVASGEIAQKRIDESVRRILQAKARLGLDKKRLVDLNQLDRILGNSEHKEAAMRMIEGAITLVRNERGVLPIKLRPDQKVLFITIVDRGDGWPDGEPGKAFLAGLIKRHRNVTAALASDQTSPAEFELVKKMASLADVIIACGFIRVAAYKGSIDLTEGQLSLLKHLSRLDKPFAFVLFGSPYLISFVPELPTYVLAYDYYPDAEQAALRALLGEIEFKGRLPVELGGIYGIGHSASPR
jgi:beta-N-acetylhexosaminidase